MNTAVANRLSELRGITGQTLPVIAQDPDGSSIAVLMYDHNEDPTIMLLDAANYPPVAEKPRLAVA